MRGKERKRRERKKERREGKKKETNINQVSNIQLDKRRDCIICRKRNRMANILTKAHLISLLIRQISKFFSDGGSKHWHLSVKKCVNMSGKFKNIHILH